MCDWCEENGGEMIGCQNCGTDICWDMQNVYVTTYGDVYCSHCGRMEQQDIDEQEEEDSDGWDFYGASWYDPDMDFENEESNGVDIGEGSETQGFFMDVDGNTVHVLGNPNMTDTQAEVLANIVRATHKRLDASLPDGNARPETASYPRPQDTGNALESGETE